MSILENAITMATKRKSAIAKGKILYKTNSVSKLNIRDFWKGEFEIKSIIKDNKDFLSSLNIKDGKIVVYDCSCGMSGQLAGLCEHNVAAAYAYINNYTPKDTIISTSEAVRIMLSQYSSKQINKKLALTNNKYIGNIKIELELKYSNYEGFKVGFKIGTEQKYIVKNISKLVNATVNEEFYKYGEKLAFYHTYNSFDERSLSVIKILEGFILAGENYFAQTKNFKYNIKHSFRYISLEGENLKKLLLLYEDENIPIEYACGNIKNHRICNKNPNFEVKFTKLNGGLSIEIPDLKHIVYSNKSLSMLDEKNLYLCDKQFGEDLMPFLNGIVNNCINVNERDIPAICRRILPILKQYLTIKEENGLNLSSYTPPELKTIFKLDKEIFDGIKLEVEFIYGEIVVKPNFQKYVVSNSFRDVSGEAEVINEISKYFDETKEQGTFVILENNEKIYEFLTNGYQLLLKLGEVYISENFKNIKIVNPPKVTVGVSINSGWLDINIDTGNFPIEELEQVIDSYNKKKKFYRLKNGTFFNLEENLFSSIAKITENLDISKDVKFSESMKLPEYRAFYIDKILKSNNDIKLQRDSYFKEIIKNFENLENSDYEIPHSVKNILREYQKEGFRWLKILDHYGFGGILADDMGLGKTIQVIALLLSEKEISIKTPHGDNSLSTSLIICPASLIYNWEAEIRQFGNSLETCIITGEQSVRIDLIKEYKNYDVIITSYDYLRRDIKYYKEAIFRFQIIDEAQFIKNGTTKISNAVKEINSMRRFALTGTPVENKLSELWSIFNYLMPGILYDYKYFKANIEAPIVRDNNLVVLEKLSAMISPFILRRLKKDVLKELPDKIEQIITTKLEGEQAKLYAASVLEFKELLNSTSEYEYKRSKMGILAQLIKLRQICCEPSLYFENYNSGSAKLETCMEILKNAIQAGHKVLLFSQFTTMLEIISKRLLEEKIEYHKLEGKTSKTDRMHMVQSFKTDKTQVFLISLKAGGTGLNLVAADVVIHYDPWWNIAAENQATDRAHRIGQNSVVSVFKIIAKDTIEENILKLQKSKQGLADKVISANNISLSSLSKEELLEIIK
jgi:Superfamily II DNA/RNA helicases, SNF2 family